MLHVNKTQRAASHHAKNPPASVPKTHLNDAHPEEMLQKFEIL
jgi:hypothetical protein